MSKWITWTVRDVRGRKIFQVKALKAKQIKVRSERRKPPMGFDPERFK